MSETTRLLKGIMKMSGWTQEQVAMKLGVSYPTMNAWVNGKSKPRQAMMDRIQRLYLAQDITDDVEPTYVTLVNVPRWLKVGDMVILKKDYGNSYDDEAISAVLMDMNEGWGDGESEEWCENDNIASKNTGLASNDDDVSGADMIGNGGSRVGKNDDGSWGDDNDEGDDDDGNNDDDNDDEGIFGGKVAPIAVNGLRTGNCPEVDFTYVANSINTVVRGTKSAGRIYDKFGRAARARVLFVFHKVAIARVVEWDYAEEGE